MNDYKTDHRQPVTNEFIKNETALEKNRSIDHTIWCILQAGFTEKTDYRQLVARMDKEVFALPKPERENAFSALRNDYFHGKVSDKKGSGGVFLLGEKDWQTLFRSFGLGAASEKQWLELIDFLSEKNFTDHISVELIESLLYVKLTQKTFMEVLCFFNSLEVAGNMNAERVYREFLHDYLAAFASLGIMDMEGLWKIGFDDAKWFAQSAVAELPEIKKRILKLKENLKEMPVVSDYLEIAAAFIDKNLEIINQEQVVSKKQSRFETHYSGSIYKNQDEFDRLKTIHDNAGPDFAKQAEEAFISEKITVYELNNILAAEFDRKMYKGTVPMYKDGRKQYNMTRMERHRNG